MKVVIASGTYPPELGGMATFVENFARRLHAQGIEVSVVAHGKEDSSVSQPFLVRTVRRGRFVFMRYLRYLLVLFAHAKKSDLVYAQDLVSSGLPAACVSLLVRKQLVIRLGGDFLWEKRVEQGKTQAPLRIYYEQSKDAIEQFYLMLYRFVLSRARLIIFNTEFQAGLYRRYFKIAADKISVVNNPFVTVSIPRSEVKKRIVYAGRFIQLKNIELLLKAYAQLSPQARLVLIGEGPRHDQLAASASALGIADRIDILPPMNREALLRYLAASQLAVVPSLTELNPNLVLESLSVGTPVLLSSENGLPPTVRQHVQEFDPTSISSLREALREALDPIKDTRRAEDWRHIEYAFTWDDLTQRHLELFKQLVK